MEDDYNSDDILDDEYFYEHYGKPPVNRGSGGCLSVFLFIVIGFLVMKSSAALGLILVIIGIVIGVSKQ